MTDAGTATAALLAIERHSTDGRALTRLICRACMAGLDVDGAVLSLLTATVSRVTLVGFRRHRRVDRRVAVHPQREGLYGGRCCGAPGARPDLHHSTEAARWPMFAAAIAKLTKVRALFALPLQGVRSNLGVLDLYRRSAGGLSAVQYRDALSAADIAALMMLEQRTDPALRAGHDEDGDDGGTGDSWLDHSSGHRAEVHQATGMVLVQLGISAADVLARLRSLVCSATVGSSSARVSRTRSTGRARSRRRAGRTECNSARIHGLLLFGVAAIRFAM